MHKIIQYIKIIALYISVPSFIIGYVLLGPTHEYGELIKFIGLVSGLIYLLIHGYYYFKNRR